MCMYVCMYACMHACMYVCMYVCMYACMHVCMYVYQHNGINRSNLKIIAFYFTYMKKCVYLFTRIEHNAPDNSEVHTARNLLHATLLEPRVWGFFPDFWEICETLHMIILKFWHPETKWPRQGGWGSVKVHSLLLKLFLLLEFGRYGSGLCWRPFGRTYSSPSAETTCAAWNRRIKSPFYFHLGHTDRTGLGKTA
jgi:hypothetical protein